MTWPGICRDSDIHLPSLSLRTSLRWLFRPPAELWLRASFLRRCSCLSPDKYFRLPKHPGLRSRPGKSVEISAGCVPTITRRLVLRRYEFSGESSAPDWCACTRRCTIPARERRPQMHFPCNSLSRAIENQQLVPGDQRFGDHRAKTVRSQQASERHRKVDERDGQLTHDPRSVPITPPSASLGFCGDWRYELPIGHLHPNTIEVCRDLNQRPTHLQSNRRAQAILCPGTGRRRLPESGSAMQRRSDLC